MNTPENVTENNEYLIHNQFSTADYVVFGLMLLTSALTGLYHGIHGRKKLTTRKYLMGSNMQVFPVAMSLVASYVSGVTILGTPAEIYNYGTQYYAIIIAILIMGTVVSWVYLPVFVELKLSSSYEYLQLRFDGRLRSFASFMFIMDEVMFLPILIYVPALAFNQVTGVNIHIIGSIVCLICIFYTLIGGLKAVVWTDTLQIIVMFISVVVITIMGTIFLGGPISVWNKAAEGRRLIFFNTNPSMYERHTIWGVIIGGTIYWTAFNAVNQTMVQRYLSLQTLKMSRSSLWVFTGGVSLFVLLCCWSGLLVFAEYGGCDPKSAGLVLADDQLLPTFVLKTAGHIPGLPGLFVAGVFGAALSSLSVVLNSTGAVLLQDVVRGLFGMKPSDRAATAFVKASVLILGLLALACVYVVEHLGGVLAVATSLSAIAAGTSFGMFSLGMLVPWCTSDGALYGAIAGGIISGWISFGSQWASATGQVVPQQLPLSTDECPFNVTVRDISPPPGQNDIFPLYRLSYHWITPIGVTTVIVTGMIISLIQNRLLKTKVSNIVEVDPVLLSPVIRWFYKDRSEDNINLKNTGSAQPSSERDTFNVQVISVPEIRDQN